MWTSAARYQASVGTGKPLRSLHWNSGKCDDTGWLALGAEEGSLGVTWVGQEGSSADNNSFNSSCIEETHDSGSFYKSSFNLRGHVGEVRLVRWRPQGDRLVTYDSWGNVKIWKNRANVLALDYSNSTTVMVRDMQWSMCGSYIAICGEDGHLQLISGLTGTQIFSIQVMTTAGPAAVYGGSHAQFTSLSWNKPTTCIALGTERGEVVDVDPLRQGQFVSTMIVHENIPVLQVCYFGPTREVDVVTPHGPEKLLTQSLSLYMANGEVVIFQNLSSASCMCVYTSIVNGLAQWNTIQTILAVVGYHARTPGVPPSSHLAARFLNSEGNIIHSVDQLIEVQPETDALLHCTCWGLGDTALFIAHDRHLFSINVISSVPTLLELCRQYIVTNMWKFKRSDAHLLPLPLREINALNSMCPSLVEPLVDTQSSFHNLFMPLSQSTRLHCIIVRETETNDNGNLQIHGYILMYEQFGSYIPLLRAKRISRRFFNVMYHIQSTLGHTVNAEPSPQSERRGASIEDWAQRVNSYQRRRHQQNTNRGSTRSRFPYRLHSSSGAAVMDMEEFPPERDRSERIADNSKYPVIAVIEGNTLLKRYKFLTTGCVDENPSLLGTLNVIMHYVRCEPRDLIVTLHHNGTRETMSSRKPEWNPQFGIFELDFGGRINRDSVKNFQIDWKSEVVFQFGRSVYGDYCLDFQYPFSPVSAFCVALASIV